MPEGNRSFQTVELPKIYDARGNLTFVEGCQHVPFAIERVYYLYDVPSGEMRAGHAHIRLKQLMIPLSGSFDLHVNDGRQKAVITMNRPNRGVLLQSMVWREIHSFSGGAVCLVIASMKYDEADYIRNYEDFKRMAREAQ